MCQSVRHDEDSDDFNDFGVGVEWRADFAREMEDRGVDVWEEDMVAVRGVGGPRCVLLILGCKRIDGGDAEAGWDGRFVDGSCACGGWC